jgi:murein L,D-transpeptidase YcbB/YkuD
MESLVVNPSWNVPESIAENEVLPSVRKDPGYLPRTTSTCCAASRW